MIILALLLFLILIALLWRGSAVNILLFIIVAPTVWVLASVLANGGSLLFVVGFFAVGFVIAAYYGIRRAKTKAKQAAFVEFDEKESLQASAIVKAIRNRQHPGGVVGRAVVRGCRRFRLGLGREAEVLKVGGVRPASQLPGVNFTVPSHSR